MLWFDLDNSPHVPLFKPILEELSRRHVDFLLTARAHAQTKDLLEMWHIRHSLVGIHGGKSTFRKIGNLVHRSLALALVARDFPISLSVSHGSRSHLMASTIMRIPYVWMNDYEFTEKGLANAFADYILLPDLIPDSRAIAAGFNMRKVIRYSGLKEEIYLNIFVPDPSFRSSLDIGSSNTLVTIRPPSVTANYHNTTSEDLFLRCLSRFSANPTVICLIVNRTSAELALIPPAMRAKRNIRILDHAIDGLQLLWHSDLVVSGGGTMNREAALLGVPTFSIFTGRRPYLDEYLQEQGRMTFIQSSDQVDRIPLEKRSIGMEYRPGNPGLASSITDLLLDIHQRHSRKGPKAMPRTADT